jgi:hypothetical protein
MILLHYFPPLQRTGIYLVNYILAKFRREKERRNQ